MYIASEVRQQRGFCAEKHGKRKSYFNCGTTSEKMRVTITISKIFEIACIIHKRERARDREFSIGQAIKSARGMPWHQEPTKDVTSCDKPRGGANIHRSVDFRMG